MNAFTLLTTLACISIAGALDLDCTTGINYLPNPEDCSSFYQCDNGIPKLINCPAGLQFDPKTEVCDFSWNVNCQVSTSTNPTTESSTTTSTTLKTTSTTSETTSTTTGPILPTCPPYNYARFPNPLDCASYYFCVGGFLHLIPCRGNKVYNPESERCEVGAKCDIRSTTTPKPTTTTVKTTSTTTGPILPTCPHDNYARFPNPLDCTSYYFCVGGYPHLIECSGSLVYDPESERCEVGAKCDIRSTTTPKPTTTTVKTTLNPNWPKCPSTGIERFENPEDCHSYFFCYAGHISLLDCNSLVFDLGQGRCVQGQCKTASTSPIPTTSTANPLAPTCASTGSSVHANPESCKSYYFCVNGFLHLINCPPNNYFDETIKECSAEATCNL